MEEAPEGSTDFRVNSYHLLLMIRYVDADSDSDRHLLGIFSVNSLKVQLNVIKFFCLFNSSYE